MANHQPDLAGSLEEIAVYLEKQRAYDLFDQLLKELLTKQPEDPLQHLIDCLQAPEPLRVILTNVPGIGSADMAQKLAKQFDLTYISSGELLKEHQLDAQDVDNARVSGLVVEKLKELGNKGWLLDGFPRTRVQTSFLNEHSIVPSHVLSLEASEAQILASHAAGKNLLGGEAWPEELLRKNLSRHCHSLQPLEPYSTLHQRITVSDQLWAELNKAVRLRPRSLAPKRPTKLVVLGPRGIDLEEHCSRLAARLDAVLVEDPTRLDSTRGWVFCGLGLQPAQLQALGAHVVVLEASVQTCIERLQNRFTDVVTKQLWTTQPQSERVRRRLQPNPQDQPLAVTAEHKAFTARSQELLAGFKGRVSRLPADGDLEEVHAALVELVERPPPLA